MKYSARDQRPKTAVIYTRVSTEEQAEHGFSLAHQEDLLRRECARKGIQVLEHFQDDGYSAKDFKRPAFQKLIDYLKRHKKQIQYLLVTKWCRFSRDVANTILMNRELQAYGTRVITLDDGEESDNPASFLLTMLNMTLPEIDNRIRSRNTRAGILRALKEGFYPYGGSPKGYAKDRTSQKTPLLIPGELAPLVKEAFEVFATGAFPIEDVRKASWKNGLKLQRSQFGQMLRNPVYMGKIYVPESENEPARLVNGVHEAIVPEDLFLKVQKILNKRMETNTHLCAKEKLRDELPLRGHLKCPQCGKNWTGSISSGNGGKYPYYHCEKGCKARASGAIAHEQLFQYLNTLQPPPEIIDLQMAMMEAKRKLLGSIFPAKLTFQDGKYRTDGLNPALAIILQKTNNLEIAKNGDIVISENVSGCVPRIGLEPTYLATPEPKSGVSTNFTTWAGETVYLFAEFLFNLDFHKRDGRRSPIRVPQK